MPIVTDTHGRRKGAVEKKKMSDAEANGTLAEVHRKIISVYEMSGLTEKDRTEMLDRLFGQKRELLAIIRSNHEN